MARISEENKILIQNQLTVFSSKHEQDLIRKHFRIFTMQGKEFCICVAWIKGSTVCIETYWRRGTKQIDLQIYKIFNRQISGLSEVVLGRLNVGDLSKIKDIKIVPISRPRITKEIKQAKESTAPKYKRNVRNKVQEENIQKSLDLNKSVANKITPRNKKEIQEAKLERALFHDSKMWKYKY